MIRNLRSWKACDLGAFFIERRAAADALAVHIIKILSSGTPRRAA